MILKDFYKIQSQDLSEDTKKYEILINKDHTIFLGHFPDNPVMPGVCMIQIIKELTESLIGEKLFMEKCANVKFTALINPQVNELLTLNITLKEIDGKYKVKNITSFDDTVALKLSATYRKS